MATVDHMKKVQKLLREHSLKQSEELKGLKQQLFAELKRIEQINYRQIESFYWLARRLSIKNSLPPLRGWPMSPDVLLKLHEYIVSAKPKVVLEFGSGISTIVICDALRQNGCGLLYSVDHLEQFANQTLQNIKKESLDSFVDLRISTLEPWSGEHLGGNRENAPLWYQQKVLEDIKEIDLLIVDGPPGSTCPYARYPALLAVYENLSKSAQIWADDAGRKDEKDMCNNWAKKYNFQVNFLPTEQGLAILTR
ncbi:MAG: class I SAM-dependent methyltransferase [Campylobacteraceae bacterium]|jgi:hypothetical protein|nr:class I SAM-dependent methyltransferase [Campylobacteraceae bacterium]